MQAAVRSAADAQAGLEQRMRCDLAPVRSERQSRVTQLRAESEDLRKRFAARKSDVEQHKGGELPAIGRGSARCPGGAG